MVGKILSISSSRDWSGSSSIKLSISILELISFSRVSTCEVISFKAFNSDSTSSLVALSFQKSILSVFFCSSLILSTFAGKSKWPPKFYDFFF